MKQKTFRITPARAGNRSIAEIREWAAGDHPRACGEQFLAVSLIASKLGSPPRVRGTDIVCPSGDYTARITPARAGNRVPGCFDFSVPRDHPRACGEQRLNRYRLKRLRGSPPRVRGTGHD